MSSLPEDLDDGDDRRARERPSEKKHKPESDIYMDYLLGGVRDRVRYSTVNADALGAIGEWTGKELGAFFPHPVIRELVESLKLEGKIGKGMAGEAYAARFGRDGLDRAVVVKVAKGKTTEYKHPLMREYRVATVLNGISRKCPHFARAIMMFSCPTFAAGPGSTENAAMCSSDPKAPMRDFIVYERINGPSFVTFLDGLLQRVTGGVPPEIVSSITDPVGLSKIAEHFRVHLQPDARIAIISALAQILVASWIAEEECGFEHNDLHMNNVIMNAIPEKFTQGRTCLFMYRWKDIELVVPLWKNRFPVMIDFGDALASDSYSHASAYGLPIDEFERRGHGTRDRYKFTQFVLDRVRERVPGDDLEAWLVSLHQSLVDNDRAKAVGQMREFLKTSEDGTVKRQSSITDRSATHKMFLWGLPRDS